MVEFLRDGFDNSEIVGALFIDIAKALWPYKIPTDYIEFIFSYLRGRTFIVRYDNKFSTSRPGNSGMPQSSKFGPGTQYLDT